MVHHAGSLELQQFIQTQIFWKIIDINISDPYPPFFLKQYSETWWSYYTTCVNKLTSCSLILNKT